MLPAHELGLRTLHERASASVDPPASVSSRCSSAAGSARDSEHLPVGENDRQDGSDADSDRRAANDRGRCLRLRLRRHETVPATNGPLFGRPWLANIGPTRERWCDACRRRDSQKHSSAPPPRAPTSLAIANAAESTPPYANTYTQYASAYRPHGRTMSEYEGHLARETPLSCIPVFEDGSH